MKATYQGHCQLCGRLQRLPNGRLAKHGYTVEFNFFNGTCPGSAALPYEQSCDLLPSRRDWAKETATKMYENAVAIRALRDSKAVWIHEYRKSYGCSSSYVWRQVELTFEFHKFESSDGGYSTATYVGHDGKVARLQTYGCNSEEQIIAGQNDTMAKYIEGGAKQHADYAIWAQKRIDGWKLAELQPVKEVS